MSLLEFENNRSSEWNLIFVLTLIVDCNDNYVSIAINAFI